VRSINSATCFFDGYERIPASRCRQVRSGTRSPFAAVACRRRTWPSRSARSIRRALEKDAITSQAMTVTGSAKMSVAYSMVVTPPAISMAMVSTAVSTAQKMRSHLAPSWDGSGIEDEKLDITMAPELALVR